MGKRAARSLGRGYGSDDFLKPHAVDLKVAHPEMLKVITAAKKKNDRADAERIADLLRVDLLPECYMLPEEIRELRRILRYRNHIVRTAVKMQNKMAGLLIEVGVPYSKKRNKHLQTMLIEAAKLARTGTGNWLSCMNGSYQRGIETGLC